MSRERVPFRLIQTPCCMTLLCYVNPRLPNFCSECGERIYAKLKTDPSSILVTDLEATLIRRDINDATEKRQANEAGSG